MKESYIISNISYGDGFYFNPFLNFEMALPLFFNAS